MNVTVIAVMRRSRSDSMVLEAMIPGTPQPVPTMRGMRDFPERPKCLNTRSMTKAILDMYPASSRMHMTRNRMSIWGRNPMTANTPERIPSHSRLVMASLTPFSAHQSPTLPLMASRVSFIQSVHQVPIPVMLMLSSYVENPMTPRKTTIRTPMNIGIPQIRLVTILSILSDSVPFSSLGALLTVSATMLEIAL